MTEANPDAAERKREQRRQYRAANRDRINAQKRQWSAANRNKIREQGRRHYEANRERHQEWSREYYAANRRVVLDRQREYYAANRQEKLKAVKAYTEANQDRVSEYRRTYYVTNGDKVRLKALRRTHGPNFVDIWSAMWVAQQGRCYLCRRPMDPAEALVEHWHGCAGHSPKKSCRYCQRGLAHQNCNFVVGHAGDDPALLRIIADNLERANADVAARQATMPQQLLLEEECIDDGG